MSAYYNEFDPYAAQWLRNLIAKNLIPRGEVDERSITDVHPDDLRGFRQCHFFAGIGGWALAARLAGWPDDRELWTGSPPCQPFSVAGKGKAQGDDRHLWPHLFRLASARRPAVLMGEQVAAAVGKGWLDGVFADMEGIGYACGAAVVPACAVDAPHRRDRLWFVARSGVVGNGIGTGLEGYAWNDSHQAGRAQQDRSASEAGGGSMLAHANGIACEQGGSFDGRGDQGSSTEPRAGSGLSCSGYGALANGNSNGCEPGHAAAEAAGHGRTAQSIGGTGAWDSAEWIIGHDGKARRVEPGIRLLAHGVSGRMSVVRPGFEGRSEDPDALHWYSRAGALKAFGNAIVPQVAAEVIGAYLDCHPAVSA